MNNNCVFLFIMLLVGSMCVMTGCVKENSIVKSSIITGMEIDATYDCK